MHNDVRSVLLQANSCKNAAGLQGKTTENTFWILLIILLCIYLFLFVRLDIFYRPCCTQRSCRDCSTLWLLRNMEWEAKKLTGNTRHFTPVRNEDVENVGEPWFHAKRKLCTLATVYEVQFWHVEVTILYSHRHTLAMGVPTFYTPALMKDVRWCFLLPGWMTTWNAASTGEWRVTGVMMKWPLIC